MRMRSNPVCALIIYCRKIFSPYVVKTFINICVITNASLIWDVGLKMQRVSLLERILNVSLLGEKEGTYSR
jgi:hypothetical protein